jgi:hypothetical protein
MFSLREWARCLYTLDESQVKQIVRGSFSLKMDLGEEVSLDLMLKLTVVDWLNGLGFLTDEQNRLIVDFIVVELVQYGKELATEKKAPSMPVFTLCIADYNFVTCAGKEAFFDLSEVEELETLKEPADTHFILDLSARYSKLLKRMSFLRQAQQRGKDADESIATRDPSKAGRGSTPQSLADFADGKSKS